MITDISACNACIGRMGDKLQYCPLREDCLRHTLFLRHKHTGNPSGIWMVVAKYKNGKCELQIRKDNE